MREKTQNKYIVKLHDWSNSHMRSWPRGDLKGGEINTQGLSFRLVDQQYVKMLPMYRVAIPDLKSIF